MSDLAQLIGRWSAGSGPLYRQLADSIRGAVSRGEIVVGTRLPPERSLAAELRVSRSTVVAAYDLLEHEGLLGRRQGSGTWVRDGAGPRGFRETPDYVGRSARTFRGLIEGPSDTIELTVAALPAAAQLDAEMLRAAAEEIAALTTDHGYRTAGYPPLRRTIAEHLTARGLPSNESQVLVTTGAQQAIGLSAALFLRPGEPAVIENPTYPGAIDVYATAGARLVPAPAGPQGAQVGPLREAIAAHRPKLVYLQPSFQNPTGALMPESRRREIAALLEEAQVPLVEDHTNADLGLDRDPPPPISAFAPGAPILTIGSTSKLFWGGLRTGWIRAPEPLIARLARMKLVIDHGSSLPAQVLARRLFEQIDRVRVLRCRELSERLDRLISLIQEHLPVWTWQEPLGGLALWARLPYGDAGDLANVALRHGVTIVPGEMAAVDGSYRDHVRLLFVHDEATMREGIERLGRAWAEYSPGAVGDRAERMQVVV